MNVHILLSLWYKLRQTPSAQERNRGFSTSKAFNSTVIWVHRQQPWRFLSLKTYQFHSKPTKLTLCNERNCGVSKLNLAPVLYILRDVLYGLSLQSTHPPFRICCVLIISILVSLVEQYEQCPTCISTSQRRLG